MYLFGVHLNGGGVLTATQTAVPLHLSTELPSPYVGLRLWPLALALWKWKQEERRSNIHVYSKKNQISMVDFFRLVNVCLHLNWFLPLQLRICCYFLWHFLLNSLTVILSSVFNFFSFQFFSLIYILFLLFFFLISEIQLCHLNFVPNASQCQILYFSSLLLLLSSIF